MIGGVLAGLLYEHSIATLILITAGIQAGALVVLLVGVPPAPGRTRH